MTTTTRTKPILSAPIDLDEPGLLETMLVDDNALVDVWDTDGRAYISMIAAEGVVSMTPEAFPEVERQLERAQVAGWGREPAVPRGVFVTDFEGEDVENIVGNIFPAARRQQFADWRVIESALGR